MVLKVQGCLRKNSLNCTSCLGPAQVKRYERGLLLRGCPLNMVSECVYLCFVFQHLICTSEFLKLCGSHTLLLRSSKLNVMEVSKRVQQLLAAWKIICLGSACLKLMINIVQKMMNEQTLIVLNGLSGDWGQPQLAILVSEAFEDYGRYRSQQRLAWKQLVASVGLTRLFKTTRCSRTIFQ